MAVQIPDNIYNAYQQIRQTNANALQGMQNQPQVQARDWRSRAPQAQQPIQNIEETPQIIIPNNEETKQPSVPQQQNDFNLSDYMGDDNGLVFQQGMFAPQTTYNEPQGVYQSASGQVGSSGLVNRVRDLEGKIGFYAEDGTNCMRTMGIALQGTPYANQINVDQAVATAAENGQLMNPAEYTPRAGDMAVVEDGNHIVMVTENGGTIQNGKSAGGVYESDMNANDMFKSGVKYYIRTSDYN